MWIKLLKMSSISKAFEPRLINGRWYGPLIKARQKARLKKQFQQAGVPWTFDKPKPQINYKSNYNRAPAKIYKYEEKQLKIQTIRYNLKQMEAKIQKFRQQNLQKRKLGGLDKHIQMAIPYMLKPSGQHTKALRGITGSSKPLLVGNAKKQKDQMQGEQFDTDQRKNKIHKVAQKSDGGRKKKKVRELIKIDEVRSQ